MENLSCKYYLLLLRLVFETFKLHKKILSYKNLFAKFDVDK